MELGQVRGESAVVPRLDAYRDKRDAAIREAQTLVDEAVLLELEARLRRDQATHVLDELEQGGQEARSLATKLGLAPEA